MSNFYNTYKEYTLKKPISPRNRLRNIYINTLASNKLKANKLPEQSVLFLTFHNCFQDKLANFKKILLAIKEQYTFLSYSACVQKLQEGNIDQRYACISADDGFANYKEAIKLFEELDILGMVFINPSIIGESNYTAIEDHCKTKLQSPPIDFLTWDDLESMKKNGHEIGNHGYSHLNLSKLEKQELTDEIGKSKETIIQRLGEVKHYAYTYGQSKYITDMAKKIIFESGHASLCSGIRGQHTKAINLQSDMIRREQIEPWYPQKHVNYFLHRSPRM